MKAYHTSIHSSRIPISVLNAVLVSPQSFPMLAYISSSLLSSLNMNLFLYNVLKTPLRLYIRFFHF